MAKKKATPVVQEPVQVSAQETEDVLGDVFGDEILPPEAENGRVLTVTDVEDVDPEEIFAEEEEKHIKLVELTEPTGSSLEKEVFRSKVKDLRSQIEDGYWDLSKALARVYGETLYIEWGFENWADYVEQELSFKLRSAQYMVSIADYFGKMPKEIQDWVKSVGWTKAKELVNKVDESNWVEWKKKIAGKSFTQIVTLMKEEKEAGSSSPKAGSTEQQEEFKKLKFNLAVSQYENVKKTLESAKEAAQSDSEAHALDLVCTSYLAMGQGSGGLEGLLESIEKMFGVSLVAYNRKSEEIVFGQELLESLGGEGEAEESDDGVEEELVEDPEE
jgi:hypothetical protein